MRQTATKARVVRQRSANGWPAPTYLALIENFPLRPLRSEREYDNAATILDRLAVRPEGSLDAGEQDYFDTLTLLVEAYDREHYADAKNTEDPLIMLKYL